ncbi:MAG: HAMP domain-containing histidine kinase [Ignavibacteriales bacterium]|nr:HAMP domain-containing histidine kinase [Ignavibacteriales bacterium]
MTERRLTALELEKINRELKLSNANKDKFFSIISHDLRSPFQSLLGFTNLLDEQFDEIDRSESKIFIENIKSTTIRLYQMLEDLLSWSRIQMGSYNPKITGLNLHTVTADVIYLMKPNAERKHIEIGNKITDTLMVLGDESMLKSIMQNLISNAVKFTPNRGTVFIEASVEDDFISVIISDSGIGMDAEKVSTLFELDKVISSEGTDGEKGSGLGLILTNEMVVKQGGQITVNSEPGKGTKICFTLLKYSGS